MRIAVIGQKKFGQAVMEAFLARGDEVAGVFVAPEKPGAEPDPLRLAAERNGIRVFQFPHLTDAAAIRAMQDLKADIGVMVYVLQFAPQSFVNIPRFGTIQYHPSLLPRYRGPSAIHWPIVCGETETGLTVFRPTDGLDEGPILLRKKVPILPDDTLGRVYFDRLFPLGVEAMLEAADLVASGKDRAVAQDESLASYEGWFRDKEARIDWNRHVNLIYNLIRGCDPVPGAWTTLKGEKVRFFGVKKHVFASLKATQGKTGTVSRVEENSFFVTAHGGQIEVFSVCTEHVGKMPAMEYLLRNGIGVDAHFGK
ncbi:MAG: methionyl-tRNA formyltransferase [Oxalobacter formigenes]|nr:methionyl-tRNA formyltransferase [Oxalobacter formigenes]